MEVDEEVSDLGEENEREVSVMNGGDQQLDLSDLLKDIDDISEPSSMDKVLLYLNMLKDEDFLFMEMLVETLRGEEVTWHQPWYQISNSLTRPVKDIKTENDENVESYRTDTICKAEHEKLLRNWNRFMEVYGVPDKLICLARWRNKEKSRLPNTPEERAKRFVIAYLARGLERTLYQVYRHVMAHFGSPNKGPYTEDEEKIIKICFTHHPDHAVTILSVILSREPRGIYKRIQQMFHGKPEKKQTIKWSLPFVSKFVSLLVQYTNLPLEELKNRRIPKEIWLKLEKKLEFSHHYMYLQNFWYITLHTQIFVKQSIKINKLRKAVFLSLQSSSYQVWKDIRWKDVVKQFPDGMTHRFLYTVCQKVVYKMPNYLTRPLSEVIDYALDRICNSHLRKRRLKTLAFNEDGVLEPIRYHSWRADSYKEEEMTE